jgi:serine/threonine protein kinase
MNVEIGDKYEILHEIKRGGFGVIYKGRDRRLGKTVAIKSIDPQFLSEARYIDMFQREAMSIAQLNHHNIVQIYDIQRGAANQLYLIMEFIDGPDLMSVLLAARRNQVAVPKHLGVYIIAEVCAGLDYAHHRRDSLRGEPMNIVHQDISPVNIMIARSGEVKIIDFGMANLRRQQSKIGNQVFVQGNIHYLAPEQVNGAAAVDGRCDIFSSAAILFEILTGERLIPSHQPREILETLVAGGWDVIRFDSENIPEKLRQPLRRALEHHPKNRYPDAGAFYKDLMSYLHLAAPAADFMGELAQFILELDYIKNLESATPWRSPAVEQREQGLVELNVGQPTPAGMLNSNRHSPGAQASAAPEVLEPPAAKDYASQFYSIVEESAEDGQRTIIDVIRLSSRTHRKAVTLGALGLLMLALLFAAVDTFAHFTKVGAGIYDFLFPPAIKIVSVPAGAQVYLDDESLNETTPLRLEKITPGVHKLILTLPQFEPIVKSINVPRAGGIRVAGERQRHASQPYIFRFKNKFELTSDPAGAEVLFDGVKTNHKTPATIFWEVAEKPLAIELELPGLPRLSGLRINTLEDKEFIEDRRLWSVEKIVPGKAQFNIKGTFHKSIAISSNPERVDIYLDHSPKPVGVTGLDGELFLKMGAHHITLNKTGYQPRSFTVHVNESTPSRIHHELGRMVKLIARDAGAPDEPELDAELVELTVNNKTTVYNLKTPAAVELLPRTYTAKLRKEGYLETFVEIPPSETTVIAKMHPSLAPATIQALDAITSDPIQSAKIMYREDRSANGAAVLGVTDAAGQLQVRLMPGFYEITLVKEGYQEQVKMLRVRSAQENRLTFRLTLAR